MRKKILFVGGTTGGGVATINNEVIRLFREAGHEYRLVDTEKMKSRWPSAVAYPLSYLLALAKMIAFRPQVVYLQIAQTGYLHQSLFLLLAKIMRRETVAHLHAKSNLRESCTPSQFRRILFSQKYIDQMILLTEPCRSCLVEGGWRKPTHVVPNFIDTADLPRDFRPVDERRKCLYLGRMDWEKGIFEVLKIARRLPEEEFVLVGNFADPAQQERFLRELQTTSNADWLGPLYGRDKYGVIAASKILVFPTRRDEFPMTLIEATILGCVPLVSPVGSVGQIVKDGFNGLYIDPEDVDGIVRKIHGLRDGERLRRMSANGIEYARTHFTSDAVRERILGIVG
jgi:glycosyltransferase involved in cell wall biosynthesis